jgi:hypothetical protein
MSEEHGKFLSRWSRRKIEARHAGEEAKPAGLPEAAAPAARSGPGESPEAAPAPLPTIDELRGLESEYRDFLRPGVDETLRCTALKKLFQDPHFNVMDGLDTYIDDYTKEDPIPEAMLKTLNQAKGLIFDREGEHGANETGAAADAAGEQVQVSAPASPLVPPRVSSDEGETGDDDVAQSGLSKPGTPG